MSRAPWAHFKTDGVAHFNVYAAPHGAEPARHVAMVFTGEKDARLIAKAPELLKIADRFFSFYELHKTARGGELGRDFEKLRAEIMEGIKP